METYIVNKGDHYELDFISPVQKTSVTVPLTGEELKKLWIDIGSNIELHAILNG